MVPRFCQEFSENPDFRPLIIECRTIAISAINRACFARHTFDQLTNGHTRRQSVWINNQVWSKSILGKWHIAFFDNQAYCSLLSTATRHFIAQIGHTFFPNANLGNAFAFGTFRHKRLVHDTELALFSALGRIKSYLRIGHIIGRQTNQNRLIIDFGVLAHNTILVQFAIIVSRFGSRDSLFRFNIGESFIDQNIAAFTVLFMSFICRIISGSEKSAFERAFIHQYCVFHIISGIAHNRHNCVFAIGVLFMINIFHISRFDEGDLARIENRRGFVHTELEIGMI